MRKIGVCSIIPLIMTSILIAALFIGVPYVKADQIEMTIHLQEFTSGDYNEDADIIIVNLDTSDDYTYTNPGDGIFAIDTDDLTSFTYGDNIEIYAVNAGNYYTCKYDIMMYDEWDGESATLYLYDEDAEFGEEYVGTMRANGEGGKASWWSSSLGPVSYTAGAGSIKLWGAYSYTSPAAPTGKTYRYEYYFKIRVIGPNQNYDKTTTYMAINTTDENGPSCGDPEFSQTFTRSQAGTGTGQVYIWIDWWCYDTSDESEVDSGNIYPNPTSKTITFV